MFSLKINKTKVKNLLIGNILNEGIKIQQFYNLISKIMHCYRKFRKYMTSLRGKNNTLLTQDEASS